MPTVPQLQFQCKLHQLTNQNQQLIQPTPLKFNQMLQLKNQLNLNKLLRSHSLLQVLLLKE
jgi:hypothetical protein